jgi:hypothetical protein
MHFTKINGHYEPSGDAYTREDMLSILEKEWKGRVPGAMFPHLATAEGVNKQFDLAGESLFVGYITLPTTDEHKAWCHLCKKTDIYSNLGQCLVGVVCTG